ncbi:MAG: tRNA (N(6)-L-threonylcarbamoyladenosine(37)-C(2))-methylthiotransferase MtaB [Alphaproteobacteria bacterium]
MNAPAQFVTFGCRLNSFETQVMADHARTAGLRDTIVVNTCAVTAEAVRQARQAVRKSARDNPKARIVVTGCAAQIAPETFADMEQVDHIIGNQEKMTPEIFTQLARPGSNAPRTDVGDIARARQTSGHIINSFGARTRAFVEVQNGCDHRCTFCVIPFGRGPSRSVPVAKVVEQIARLVDAGLREVVLTGVDITSYGGDLPDRPSLGILVQAILAQVADLPRLRLSSIDSIEADAALFDALGDQRLMPHLHLSLQSGDNMILKRMKRRHQVNDVLEFCDRARAARADMVFGADFIAGFPTETEAMFEQTLAHVEACGLTYLHVFPFSPRAGTPAEKMPQVAGPVIRARAQALRHRGEARVRAFLAAQVGCARQVLVEQAGAGRTEHYAPVDLATPESPGTLVQARITGQAGGRLAAERVG